MGKGREIVAGQKIHYSVAFRERSNYVPRAQAKSSEMKIDWNEFVGSGDVDDISWTRNWDGRLEMDLLDESGIKLYLKRLQDSDLKQSVNDIGHWLNHLRFMALSREYHTRLVER